MPSVNQPPKKASQLHLEARASHCSVLDCRLSLIQQEQNLNRELEAFHEDLAPVTDKVLNSTGFCNMFPLAVLLRHVSDNLVSGSSAYLSFRAAHNVQFGTFSTLVCSLTATQPIVVSR